MLIKARPSAKLVEPVEIAIVPEFVKLGGVPADVVKPPLPWMVTLAEELLKLALAVADVPRLAVQFKVPAFVSD